jgi:hypothetical protein
VILLLRVSFFVYYLIFIFFCFFPDFILIYFGFILANKRITVEFKLRGVHGLVKSNRPGQTHPIQKMGWVGLLGGYGFQNGKFIKKRVSDKIEPKP